MEDGRWKDGEFRLRVPGLARIIKISREAGREVKICPGAAIALKSRRCRAYLFFLLFKQRLQFHPMTDHTIESPD